MLCQVAGGGGQRRVKPLTLPPTPHSKKLLLPPLLFFWYAAGSLTGCPDAIQVLNAHNADRKLHGCPNLAWDNDLAMQAKVS